MTVVLNIPATLTCDKCGKKTETTIPYSQGGCSLNWIVFTGRHAALLPLDPSASPAAGDGWKIDMHPTYGKFRRDAWFAFCPDCKEAEE